MKLNKFTRSSHGIKTDIRKIPTDKHEFLNIEGIMDRIAERYPDGTVSKTMPITIQITEACNLCCSYCFQINKSPKTISFDDCKKFIDYLLTRTPENCDYINPKKNHVLVFGFVGGDALLEIDLIDKFLTYFVEKAIELDHPWANNWLAHLDTNGVLYFDKRVQALSKKWPNIVGFCITVEGNKELHDKCRVFPDGSGSYDYALRAAMDQFAKGRDLFSKITTAPENIDYLYDAFINMIDVGYTYIYSNAVYENVWKDSDATRYYHQLIRVADYLIEHDYYKTINVPVLELYKYREYATLEDNICGGNGTMLTLSHDRRLYNCYRFTSSSLKPGTRLLDIGDLDNGIGATESQRLNIQKLQSMCRLTCSDVECLNCPIAENCNYCNGCNYHELGDPGKRTKFHCLMHCAAYLVAVYYYNNIEKKKGSDERYEILIPEDKIFRILSEQEYNKLIESWKEDK